MRRNIGAEGVENDIKGLVRVKAKTANESKDTFPDRPGSRLDSVKRL